MYPNSKLSISRCEDPLIGNLNSNPVMIRSVSNSPKSPTNHPHIVGDTDIFCKTLIYHQKLIKTDT